MNHKGIKWIMHRGLSSKFTENTMESFIAASKIENIFGIETDIHLTSDDVFVCHHDKTTDRIYGVSHEIKYTDYDVLKKLGVVKLISLVELAKLTNKHLFIELKENMNVEEITSFYHYYKENQFSNFTVISFHRENLSSLRELDPKIPMLLLDDKVTDDNFEFVLKYNIGFSLHYQAINEETMKKILTHQIELNVWTVNDIKLVLKLHQLGVRCFTTDKDFTQDIL